MLGKGLESLIPQKGNSANAGQPLSGSGAVPVNPNGVSVPPQQNDGQPLQHGATSVTDRTH